MSQAEIRNTTAAVKKSRAAADSAIDPIFAIIEQHKAALDATEAKLTEKSRIEEELIAVHGAGRFETNPRWIAADRAASAPFNETERLARALLDTRPTTAAGLATLIGYVYQYEAD